MAIITCPECGKQISDQAVACVGCGCPMESIKQRIVSTPQSQAIACPKCGSIYVDAQAVNEKVPLGAGRIIAIIILVPILILMFEVTFSSGFLAFMFGGTLIAITIIALVFLVSKGRKYRISTYFVCQSCGNKWNG